MGYRTDFEILLQEVFESINVLNIQHDAKIKEGNKPDFIVKNGDVPVLYIEAKDIGVSLDKVEKSEQMSRYFGYDNLILTDYVEFRFYRNGIRYIDPVKIAEYDISKRKINPLPENFEHLNKSLFDFTQTHKEPIRSAEHLSKIMGGKAQRIRDNVIHFLSKESDKNQSLLKLYETIKKLLVHDLNKISFADLYAQTLVYGLFVARYYDDTPDNFSRQEARELIPRSNPLLRHFFDHILGLDYDTRLKFIVDELCFIFSHANVHNLMKQYIEKNLFGDNPEGPDPVIHFYEDFLKEYDPEMRKKLGAFYTPLPVVKFIVRSVDKILEKDFGLTEGLADTSKLPDGKHQVQILDPAAGTGTFILETLNNIYQRFTDQKGRWPKYVLYDLLPRLHGFELMMAPYTIAHLKLSIFLKDTGFIYFNNARLGIYLTNSLEETKEESNLFTMPGFAESIADESKEAAVIKNEMPIMVVLGNPPYSVSSSNKGEWIQNLTKVYKEDLNERNIQPLSDDYIKFIRFAEHFIEKNKNGIVAMITNNSFLDGIIHRQMRKQLLKTFDDIYIIDLHGNSKKKEKTPDGGKDENVFEIMQGVSINIFVRKDLDKTGLGNVYHSELFGTRKNKFKSLNSSNVDNVKWNKLDYTDPYYFFVPKDFEAINEYENFKSIKDIFIKNSSGIKTHRDHFIISFTEKELNVNLTNFENQNLNDEYVYKLLNLKDTRDWNLKSARKKLQIEGIQSKLFKDYLWRPFDFRRIYYSSFLIELPRIEVLGNMFNGNNLSLCVSRKIDKILWDDVYITNKLSDVHSASGQTYVFPLYLYSEDDTKIPNLEKKYLKQIESITGKVSPEEILDYIYAVLHSPKYREKFKEFLKIDFPRIPYPKDKNTFASLSALGEELRLLHLLESPVVKKYITTYNIEGTDTVEKIVYKNGNVFINSEQYFGNVPETAWNFYIGGYQPAQKWLKDRKGRTLNNSDIEHYQKMIIALQETDRIMNETDKFM
ncbi:MAG: type ISP restriction/modification enzyme [Ignavibacteria bacterium]